MFEALIEYFYNIFYTEDYGFTVNVLDASLPLHEYMALICAYISIIFIIVLCCLFVYKIIKLVGNLIR